MKKIKYYSFLVAILVVLSGCTKFLDLAPRNQRSVQSLTDVKAVFSGYLDGYATRSLKPIAGPFPTFLPAQINLFGAYSDDIDFDKAVNTVYVGALNPSQPELFYGNALLWNDYDTPKAIWNSYYDAIGFLNTLIAQVNDIKVGDETTRTLMLGEMLTHRAFYFFKLLEYFAPYDNNDMGIPVYLNTGSKNYGVANPRVSQKEAYQTILKDLTDALALIPKAAPKTGFNIWYSERSINNLLAQVYWFKAESAAKETTDYTNAKTCALIAVKDVDAYIPTTTVNLNNAMRGAFLGYPAYGNNSNLFNGIAAIYGSAWDYAGYNPSNVPVNPALYNLYTTGDIRIATYFKSAYVLASTWPDGVTNGSKNGMFVLFQPEEAYLILAEAHYRLNETVECMAVLNKFKSFRNAGTVAGLTGTALLQEIKNERRKEFFGHRDVRWLDLKRYKEVTITRKYSFFKKAYNITVAPNDFRYALPIPLDEIQLNPSLIANPGWVPIVF